VTRADDRAIANVRAAARRRPPPFPGSTPGRPLSLDAQARERPCHCHAEGADNRGLPLTDEQVYLVALGHYGITYPHPRYELPTMCDASRCAICGGYVTAWDRPR